MLEPLLMAAAGPILIAVGIVMHLRQRAARRAAVPVLAMVLDSGSERIEDGRLVWVRYRYTVDGEQYQSSRVYPPPGPQPRGGFFHVRRLQRRYPKGSSVTAYYHPDKPGCAFLENRFEWLHAVPVVLGVALVGLAIRSIWFASS